MSDRPRIGETAEWLEPDGLGGFASGTAVGVRTRRYHALLLTAAAPPSGRMVLVNGLDAWVEADDGSAGERVFLTRQRYAPDILAPEAPAEIESFEADPWPTWVYRLRNGTRIEHELFVPRGRSLVALRWRVLSPAVPVRLEVRPFLSGRDYHSLHHANPAFDFEPVAHGDRLRWTPYPGVPRIDAVSNGVFRGEPQWYRNFLYAEERARGLDCEEDLAAPGIFAWELGDAEAVLILGTAGAVPEEGAAATYARLRSAEHARRARLGTGLVRAADAYVVRRGSGSTIVAGYPWFTDWGRDTFIALRGLCLATGRLAEARSILLEWAGQVSEGMLPNRFADQGDTPEFNSVDASLWYVVAVHDYLKAVEAAGGRVPAGDRKALGAAVTAIVAGYSRGTRYGIRLEPDGLLAAGAPGVQLTWMDAKVGDWVVTPRIGKPVEVQALWLNALRIAEEFTEEHRATLARGLASFNQRFRNLGGGYLHDVVDVDHRPGTVDRTLRPNQILAVGGLPYAVVDPELARLVVDAVERRLWTPLGLRTLPQDDPRYVARYTGDPVSRDGAYHQGTVWPWLLGPFVEAWVRVRGEGASVRREARGRFLEPLLAHLRTAGLGHVSEIADADPPHTPRGCPFQAWSVGEALRLDLLVLGARRRSGPTYARTRHALAS
ncbi:MAG TPA: amylo-alpha-1,6-glucosidase [Gemmatimonadales bacterium]|nr:amylo-alpha-1,6-glucosidase [Gemmatimonadales bacterium]